MDKNNEVKEGVIMAVLATPKKNSYIIKKGCCEQIINSKPSKAKAAETKKNAELFAKNNLVKR